jgi:hypothetical protein
VIDPQPGIASIGIPEELPECVDPLIRMNLTAAPHPGFRLGQLVAVCRVVDDRLRFLVDERGAIGIETPGAARGGGLDFALARGMSVMGERADIRVSRASGREAPISAVAASRCFAYSQVVST